MPSESHTPILIVGAGTGGVAAALAVASRGIACVLTEPTDWVGGQLTSQAVPPDENPWIEGRGGVQSATRSYLDFRHRVRQWYRDHRDLTPEARHNKYLNPGNGWVSHLCFEPTVGHAVLLDLLAPHLASGLITLLLHTEPVAADVDRDTVRSVTLRNLLSDQRTTVTFDYVIDASELGDLFPLTGCEHAVGAEHRDIHGELHGRADHTDPFDQQAVSWCFAMEHRPGEDHTIDKPAGYEQWKAFVPEMDPPWPGPLFSWVCVGADDQPRTLAMTPWPDEPRGGELELWRYRRIVDRSLYQHPPTHAESLPGPPDVSLVNWVQMDYFRQPTLPVCDSTAWLDHTPPHAPHAAAESRRGTKRLVPAIDPAPAFAAAKHQSLCFFYWMQTDAPRHDSAPAPGSDRRTGYPGLKLRGDELGTADGFAKAPYIREARRLIARTIVTEAHIGTDQRRAAGHPDTFTMPPGSAQHPPEVIPAAHPFHDSAGIGHYRLDLHPSTAGRNSLYVQAAPFQIPLGSLIPVRLKNLLAGAKNLGVTHITNGCYRLHPVEWNVGESAGHLAAHCLTHKRPPAHLHANSGGVAAFQNHLAAAGIPLAWPRC